MKLHRFSIKIFVWIFILFVSGNLSFSAPVDGEIVDLEQPDGSIVQVRFWGDEYYTRGESLDGYTLVRNCRTGWIVYADTNAEAAEFEPTDVIYDHRFPTDPNHPSFVARLRAKGASFMNANGKSRGHGLTLQKGLKLSRQARLKKHRQRRMELQAASFSDMDLATYNAGVDFAQEMAPAPLTGSLVGLTILVEFQDVRGTIPASEVENFCNQVGYSGYGNNGSVRDYFYGISGGALEYTNVVTDYILLDHDKAYYDNGCDGWGLTGELIDEAMNKLCAQGFDFSAVDKYSNRITALNIFYAGGRGCGWSNGLWPHKSDHGFTSTCGIKTGTYQITDMGSELKIGTFCHENGHMICSWPDLYDYGKDSKGCGNYDLMAGGNYAGSGRNPVPPNPYFRYLKGWETYIDISDSLTNFSVTANTFDDPANPLVSYIYRHPTNTKEYFLIENCQKIGRRSNIPDAGLLIWHIDEAGSNENQEMTPELHYKVSVEQADGLFQLENNTSSGGGGDLFHAGYKDEFSDATLPDSKWWDGSDSGLSIKEISGNSTNMSFSLGNSIVRAQWPLEDSSVAVLKPVLNWVGLSEEIASYQIYFGTSRSAVINATTVSPEYRGASAVASYDPGTLQYNGEYYWRIDAVMTDSLVVKGNVWHFYTPFTSDVVNQGRLAYWALDSEFGTIAADSSRNNNYGRLVNGPVWTGDGIVNRAVELDGINDKVQMNPFNDGPLSAYTVSLWVKAGQLGQVESTGVFCNTPSKDGADFQIDVDGGNPGNYRYNGAASAVIGPVTTNWVHLAVVCDGAMTRVYYNGSLVSRFSDVAGQFDALVLGANRVSSKFFKGIIDEFYVYDRSLNTAEIAELYKQGSKSQTAHWTLDETSGVTASDVSGNGHDGICQNGLSFDEDSVNVNIGSAINLDGTNHIQAPALNLHTSSTTFSCWINPSKIHNTVAGLIFSRAASTIAGLNLSGNNELRYHWTANNNTWGFSSGIYVPINQWVFTVLTIEPSKATLYMHDGTKWYTSVNSVPHEPEEFDGVLYLGWDINNADRHFDGAIDDVRIHSYSLQSDSIEKLYYQSINTPPTGLAEASHNTYVDLSWDENTDKTGYNLYRSTSSGGPYTKIAHDIQSNVYTDNDVANFVHYYYVLTALDVCSNESVYSDEMMAYPTYQGDLTRDGKVNMDDMSALSNGWLDVYNMPTLLNIAEEWLID